MGDDIVTRAEMVTAESGDTVAVLTLAGKLQNDLYRLSLCSNLEDAAGNPLNGAPLPSASAQDFTRQFRVWLNNAFPNPSFDCDKAHWNFSGEPEQFPLVPNEDVEGLAESQSLRMVTTPTQPAIGINTCTELPDGARVLRFGLNHKGHSFSANSQFQLQCQMSSEPRCSNLTTMLPVEQLDTNTAGWQFTEAVLDLPTEAESVQCHLLVQDVAGTGVVQVDNLFLTIDLFRSGFESGGLWGFDKVVGDFEIGPPE